jgi:hypothetical protein
MITSSERYDLSETREACPRFEPTLCTIAKVDKRLRLPDMGTKSVLVVAVAAAMVPVVQSAAVAKSQCEIHDGGACRVQAQDQHHVEPATPATYHPTIGIAVTHVATGSTLNT